MAIEGPVRELALSDLLQLLFLSRRTGSLIVRDEPSNREVVLELNAGALTGATTTSTETKLGRLLVGSGRATEGQIEVALGEQRSSPGSRLGEILVGMGAVREAVIRRHLQLQVEEAVFDLLRWTEGQLRFEERSPRQVGGIEIRLPTDMILMDAVRRLDEWAEVTANAPGPDPLPRLAGGGTAAGAPLSLQPLEWEVLAKVDGVNTLQRIARGLGRPELEVARAIYGLASAGIIEIGSRPTPSSNGKRPGQSKQIEAVETALREGDLEHAARGVAALLTARPEDATVHLLDGRIAERTGDPARAIRAFEEAIDRDPLQPAGYFHLARVLARAGDFRRARQLLGTYQRLPDSSTARRQAAEKIAIGIESILSGLEVGE